MREKLRALKYYLFWTIVILYVSIVAGSGFAFGITKMLTWELGLK